MFPIQNEWFYGISGGWSLNRYCSILDAIKYSIGFSQLMFYFMIQIITRIRFHMLWNLYICTVCSLLFVLCRWVFVHINEGEYRQFYFLRQWVIHFRKALWWSRNKTHMAENHWKLPIKITKKLLMERGKVVIYSGAWR